MSCKLYVVAIIRSFTDSNPGQERLYIIIQGVVLR